MKCNQAVKCVKKYEPLLESYSSLGQKHLSFTFFTARRGHDNSALLKNAVPVLSPLREKKNIPAILTE